MDQTMTSSAMSSSLFARDIYCVCFTERDSLELIRGELASARKKFFTGGRKTVKVGKNEIVKGFDGKLQGKLTRRSLYWKKTASKVAAGKVALEEAFDQKGGYVVVMRDFRNIITSRVFFDKNHIWIKSEYYEPWDFSNARVIFKPVSSADQVERFDWDSNKKRYRSTMLYPLAYLSGSAEQSIVNARFGEPQLILSTGEGEFCYCPQKETEQRKKALTEINDGTIVLMPAWEVKDGSLAGDEGEEDTNITFTSLEEYARVEPPKETESSHADTEKSPAMISAEAKDISQGEASDLSQEPAGTDGYVGPIGPAQTEEFTPASDSSAEAAEAVSESVVEAAPAVADIVVGSVIEASPVAEETLSASEAPAVSGLALEAATAAESSSYPQPKPQEILKPQETEEEKILAAARRIAGNLPVSAPAPAGKPLPTEGEQILAAAKRAEGIVKEEQEKIPVKTAEAVIETSVPEAGQTVSNGQVIAAGSGLPYTQTISEGKVVASVEPEAAEPAEPSDNKTVSAVSAVSAENEAPSILMAPGFGAGYRGGLRDGKYDGRGRTEQQNGLTIYDGEYADGKRHGFGVSHYKDGNLSYAGFWNNDRKDGLGVSFRDSDHALHVANWSEGEPGGFVSLFDKDGNLRYGGRIENGKKQGAGVSYNGEDSTFFVGKWVDGEASGLGSSFDQEGNLLYYGGWKNGRRSGHGTEFDKNGGIIFDGEWKDGKYHNGILYQKQAPEAPVESDTSGPSWDL